MTKLIRKHHEILRIFQSFAFIILAHCLIICQAQAGSIIRVTPTIEPGKPFNIYTSGGDSSSTVSAQIVNPDSSLGASYPLTIIQHTDSLFEAFLPVAAPVGQRWRIEVTDSNNMVNTSDVNLPDVYFTNQDDGVVPGEQIKIYGVNMVPPGLSTSPNTYLKFVDSNGNVTEAYNAPQRKGLGSSTLPPPTDYENTFTIPKLTPGPYTLIYSNSLGETPITGTVTAYPANTNNDPLGLAGVWWGNQFGFASNAYNATSDSRLPVPLVKCDGVTDDTAAFQKALTYINNKGGGTYLLPAATCLIAAGNINLPSNIIIQGAGIGKTILPYGANFNPANPPPHNGLFYFNQAHIGLMGLTIQDLSTGGVQSKDFFIGGGGAPNVQYVFFKNVEFDMPDPTPRTAVSGLVCAHMDHFVAVNSNFNSGGGASTYFHNVKDLWLITDEFSHRFSREGLGANSKVVFNNNTINWNTDQSSPISPESGGVEGSISSRVVIENSHFIGGINKHVNPANGLAYDGELINLQNDGGANFVDIGTVSSATPTTITDNSKQWATGFSTYLTPYSNTVPSNLTGAPWLLYITDGTDAGDVKVISAKTPNSLTVSSPFAVVPDQTSKYAVYRSGADHFIIQNNNLTGGSTCLQDWNGAYKLVFANNTTSNCGSVNIRSNQNYVTADSAPVTGGNLYDCTTFAPAWDNLIKSNTISNDNGQNQSKVVIDASLWNDCHGPQVGNGMLMFDNIIDSNTIIPNNPPAPKMGI